jgi:hypothetical protein
MAALSGFIFVHASGCGGSDQLHDLLDIFQHALKFPAYQIDLGVGSENLSVRSDRGYLF